MSERLLICSSADLAEGSMRRVKVPGYDPLALARFEGTFYLFDDTCSHGLASLSEGDLADGQVFCPFHGGAFDLATGKPTERPCTQRIAVHPLIEVDGDLFVAARE